MRQSLLGVLFAVLLVATFGTPALAAKTHAHKAHKAHKACMVGGVAYECASLKKTAKASAEGTCRKSTGCGTHKCCTTGAHGCACDDCCVGEEHK